MGRNEGYGMIIVQMAAGKHKLESGRAHLGIEIHIQS